MSCAGSNQGSGDLCGACPECGVNDDELVLAHGLEYLGGLTQLASVPDRARGLSNRRAHWVGGGARTSGLQTGRLHRACRSRSDTGVRQGFVRRNESVVRNNVSTNGGTIMTPWKACFMLLLAVPIR